jgi:hypothetical protein
LGQRNNNALELIPLPDRSRELCAAVLPLLAERVAMQHARKGWRHTHWRWGHLVPIRRHPSLGVLLAVRKSRHALQHDGRRTQPTPRAFCSSANLIRVKTYGTLQVGPASGENTGRAAVFGEATSPQRGGSAPTRAVARAAARRTGCKARVSLKDRGVLVKKGRHVAGWAGCTWSGDSRLALAEQI